MRSHHTLLSLLLALGMGLFMVAPVAAQTDTTWTGQYYNNAYLIGTPTVTQMSSAISFDWGEASPAPGIPADGFSVRWTTRADFQPGTYRFFARADDAIRVQVDFQPVLSTFGSDQVGQLVSVDVPISGGTRQIQVDYREESGSAYAFVSWENAAVNPIAPNFAASNSPDAPTTTGNTNTQDVELGWTVQYYGNNSLSGLPTAILSESDINHNWGTGSPFPSVPADNFSGRWTTNTTFEAGTYRFSARADDGVRVLVDGQLVVDNWENAVGRLLEQDVNLTAGNHNITVEYREFSGEAYIEMRVARVVAGASGATDAPTDPGVPTNTGATGTVDAFRLNVRAAPTTEARVVAKIERGETYPIIGRNADTSWWQVDVNGVQGWAFASFVVDANSGAVPVTSSSSQVGNVPGTGFFATATASVNLRSRPTTAGAILGQLPQGARAEITGRNSTGTWIQINYNGRVSWVSNNFVSVPVPTSDIPAATE